MPEGPVYVLGSAVVDTTYQVESLPLPGESAVARAVLRSLGGKGANQAAAARRLGAPTVFLGRVGDDEGGRDTVADLAALGVELAVEALPGVPTGHAAVVVDEEGENQIAVHLGANARLTVEDVEAQRDAIASAAVFVAQLEVPLQAVRAAAEIAATNEEGTTLLNAAPMVEGMRDVLGLFDLVVVNRLEAEGLAEVGVNTIEDAKAALRGLAAVGVREGVVTLGRAGALCVDQGRIVHVPAPAVEAVDTTGAGDAFVGALAAHLREGMTTPDAVDRACRYAALSTTKPGTRAAYVDRAAFDEVFPPE